MDGNDDAGCLDERAVLEPIASKLAPTLVFVSRLTFLVGLFHRAEKRASALLLRVFEDLRRRALFVNLPL